MTNYVWFETLFEPVLEQSSSQSKKNRIGGNQSIRGDYKMKSGRIYLRAATSWAWLKAQRYNLCNPHNTIANDRLTGNRTPIQHQLCSLIGLAHVTAGNPSSSWIVIVWLGTLIAFFSRLAYHKIAIVWQGL